MKKSVAGVAVVMMVAGIFLGAGAGFYRGNSGIADKNADILTPAGEEGAFSKEESLETFIPDEEIPLAGGPDGMEAAPQVITAPPVIQENPYVFRVISLVNEERTKAGLLPLEKADDVSAAAGVRARELTESFSHTRPDGSSYRTVLEQNGITFRSCGENVAYGYRSPEAVMSAWMGSEGHRENILNEKYTGIGVGYFKDNEGQEYWAQIFTVKVPAP